MTVAIERRSRRPADRTSAKEFAEAINVVGLIDAGFSGNRFTWCNNQGGTGRIAQMEGALVDIESRMQEVPPGSAMDSDLQKEFNDFSSNITLATEKQRKAQISSISLPSGETIVDQAFIKSTTVEHFVQYTAVPSTDRSQLLDFIPSLLTQQDNVNLMVVPSIQEVYQAVLSIPMDGAAGPDGFFGAFFAGCWPTIAQDIHNVAVYVFKGGVILRAINAPLICLIPKSASPSSFSDFHPISLCNSLYKIMEKFMSSRLSNVLPKLISSEQGAFIQGRLISENIALAQELFREVNRKTRGGNIVLKVDMEKAYDRVDWAFLKQVLLRFVAEVLSRGLKALLSQELVLPFKLRRGCPQISHLLNADDTLLFLNGSLSLIRVMKAFLDSYQEASGQSINQRKSSFIYANNLTPTRIRSIERALEISKAASPLTYLGVPLAVDRLKSVAFQPLLDRVEARISGWQARLLS
ncbi:uncharacterized protein LOC131218185 [Magnolia sinica]|uniref:uncharacterized protein LOC131218185 n=1 Tax=Magnolia sinica TaxID=86752 RepID=UPI00265A3DEF|nr:uncharacterized protein LOC131218185 [Magnolia sinica]